mgnify:CR=1 FL=1
MSEKIRVLLSEEEVDARIQEVADMINKDYDGKDVHMICVLKGGVFFMCELAKRITRPVTLDFMSVSSYGNSTSSSGKLTIKLAMLAIPLVLIVAGYVIYLRKYKISKEFYDSMLADIKSREAEASADR